MILTNNGAFVGCSLTYEEVSSDVQSIRERTHQGVCVGDSDSQGSFFGQLITYEEVSSDALSIGEIFFFLWLTGEFVDGFNSLGTFLSDFCRGMSMILLIHWKWCLGSWCLSTLLKVFLSFQCIFITFLIIYGPLGKFLDFSLAFSICQESIRDILKI